MSPALELFEDPVPRLARLLPCHQALLVYRVSWDVYPLARTPVHVAADIRIAVAQTTIIIAA